MVVLPASYRIDFVLFKVALGANHVEVALEKDFSEYFPDCEPGAMSPFGNLYDLSVYVALSLTKDKEILFNAGTHNEVIRMRYKDFEKIVHPIELRISEHI